MKIRLTKETLGLPEDTVLEGDPMKLTGAIMLTVKGNPEASNVIMIADGFFEEIPEPTEADRLREELDAAKAIIHDLNAQIQELTSDSIKKPAEPKGTLTGLMRACFRSCSTEPLTDEQIDDCLASMNKKIESSKPPEPQYRMLQAGEIIQEGDEYLALPNESEWIAYGKIPRMLIPILDVGRFRRRVG